ncbi:MAG: ATP-binding protein [Phycisphaerales bacterium]
MDEIDVYSHLLQGCQMTQPIQTDSSDHKQHHELLKYAIDEHAIVAITDPSGVITFVNEKFCAISQYSRKELVGSTHNIINSGHHPKIFFIEMWATIASGKTWRGEVCNRAKDGSLYWVDTTIVPYIDECGKITQHIAIRADITDRKKTEHELRQANAELEEFVYTASHDLKSPLLTIEGYSGYLKSYVDDGDTENSSHCIKRITAAIDRMKSNIDDLLELSKIGRVELKWSQIKLEIFIKLLLNDLEEQVHESGARIVVDDDLPEIWCDPVRIQQLLANMISNAIKHGCPDDGEFVIKIGTEKIANGIKLFVSDNGRGVEAEYRNKVFELFHRLDTGIEGTGVGLNMVKRVAEVHGGRAWIEMTLGGGATICATIPTRDSKYAYQSQPGRKSST